MDRPQTVVINVNFIRLLSIQVFRQGFSAPRRRTSDGRREETSARQVPCGALSRGAADMSERIKNLKLSRQFGFDRVKRVK